MESDEYWGAESVKEEAGGVLGYHYRCGTRQVNHIGGGMARGRVMGDALRLAGVEGWPGGPLTSGWSTPEVVSRAG